MDTTEPVLKRKGFETSLIFPGLVPAPIRLCTIGPALSPVSPLDGWAEGEGLGMDVRGSKGFVELLAGASKALAFFDSIEPEAQRARMDRRRDGRRERAEGEG